MNSGIDYAAMTDRLYDERKKFINEICDLKRELTASQAKVKELEAQVKAMRNHQNCKYGDTMGSNEHCLNGCMCSKDLPNWEPKEAK
jgi:hypothetical protein